VKEKVTDSPDSYALFEYEFTGKDIQVKKLQQFLLLPEKDVLYTLVDVKEGQAVIKLPGDKGNYLIVPDPRPPEKRPRPSENRSTRDGSKFKGALLTFSLATHAVPLQV